MDADEVVSAPKGTKMRDMRGKGCEIYAYSMTVSVLDCTRLRVLRGGLPGQNQGPDHGAFERPTG